MPGSPDSRPGGARAAWARALAGPRPGRPAGRRRRGEPLPGTRAGRRENLPARHVGDDQAFCGNGLLRYSVLRYSMFWYIIMRYSAHRAMRVSWLPEVTSVTRNPIIAALTAVVLAASGGGAALAASGSTAADAATATQATPAGRPAPAPATCVLGANKSITHVIYMQFDNVHFTRDDPRVPSDLEQLPNLLNFIKGNGTLITHEHTPLIAHTADDIVTSESGLYGSDQGVPIANEYHYYVPNGTSDEAGSFAYWTDPIVDYYTGLAAKPVGDKSPTLVGANGKNAPAPWVSYTRAGCDFGTVAAADTELENTLPDVPDVFGAHSPEAREAGNPSSRGQAQAEADFMGLAVHCALRSHVCGAGSRPDVLRDEPGGYHGFRALYGNKFIRPVISPAGPVRSLNGQVIKDSFGQAGFPGYDSMTGPNALAYTLDMQLHGISVTDTYLSDLHDSWTTGNPFGPGQAGYEAQLRAENKAFGEFFSRLAAHGITKANTLFVITADEGDHFVGSKPSPATCNGVTVTCHYSRIGEVNANLSGLLAARGIKTPFDVQADSAPVIYVHGQPGPANARVRQLERAVAGLRGDDLATGARGVKLTDFLADPAELRILHMITGDRKRTPTLVVFGNNDFWQYGSSSGCSGAACFTEPAGTDAWNHGTIGSKINTTWLGMVGPGIAHLGTDRTLWSDHSNIQPTMMALLGLHDDYVPDGRVLSEIFTPAAIPPGMRVHRTALLGLGRTYTQLEAPLGIFAMATLRAATKAIASNTKKDKFYLKTEADIADLGQRRDALAARISAALTGAEFRGQPVPIARANALIKDAGVLLKRAEELAAAPA
jgi:hypothetical protein